MAGTEMTEAQRRALKLTFRGPRPGSNAWSYLRLPRPEGDIAGEEVAALIRDGLLVGSELKPPFGSVKGGMAGPYGEIPDVDLTHKYASTHAGRAALQDHGDG